MEVPTPRTSSRESLIVEALCAILRLVDGAAKTPETRGLKAQARSYEQAVKHWATVPPSRAQLDAMFEIVIELHARAVEVVSLPRGSQGT